MYIVGDRIQVQSGRVRRAVLDRDDAFIWDLASRQVAAGADAIDLNLGGSWKGGAKDMAWLVKTAQAAVQVPLFIDSAEPEVLEAGIAACRNFPVINSADANPKKLRTLVRLARTHQAALVVLPMCDGKLPMSLSERASAAEEIVRTCETEGLDKRSLLIDVLVLPVYAGAHRFAGLMACLEFTRYLSQREVSSVAGIRNASYGLEEGGRAFVERTFLTLAAANGLDVALSDPLDEGVRKTTEFLRRLFPPKWQPPREARGNVGGTVARPLRPPGAGG